MNRFFLTEIPEQEEIMKDFEDPVEFLINYITVFKNQLNCSMKVFLNEIPYYKKFHVDFIKKILEISINEPIETSSIFIIEEIILFFKDQPFHDKDFLICCASIMFKGYNILLSRAEEEILNDNFVNIGILYKYSSYDIDISNYLIKETAKKIINNNYKAIEIFKNNIDIINNKIKNIEKSKLFEIFDKNEEELINIKLHKDLLGTSRKYNYVFIELMDFIIQELKDFYAKTINTNTYYKIVEITEELANYPELKLHKENLNVFAKIFISNDIQTTL